ncbi:hypothetical protein SXANM310S_06126 [Streptomyces xanthochromogenes]
MTMIRRMRNPTYNHVDQFCSTHPAASVADFWASSSVAGVGGGDPSARTADQFTAGTSSVAVPAKARADPPH